MKNIQVYLCFALFLAGAYCQFAGYSQVAVFGNEDPQACILSLTYAVKPNKVVFTEMVSNPNWDCSFQNLTFVSLFWGYAASGAVNLIQDNVNPNKYVGEFKLQQLKDNNGTSCVNVQPHGSASVDVYVCRFAYGWNKLFEFFLAVDASSGDFQQWSNGFFPLYGATVLANQNNTVIWKTGNTSVTDIIAMMYKDCGLDTWSKNIPSASNEVYLTGTLLASNRINLQAIFTNIQLFSVIIRKPGNPKNYRTRWIANFAFNSPPVNNCSDIGLTYGSMVGGMNFCSQPDGCEVSVYMQGYSNQAPGLSTYVLRTSGFNYTGNLLRG